MKLPIPELKKLPGASPGQAVFVGEQSGHDFRIEEMIYDGDHFNRTTLDSAKDFKNETEPGKKSWIYVSGIHDTAQVEAFAEKIGLHRLNLEDVLNTDHRPKIEFRSNYIIVILKILEPLTISAPHNLTVVLMEKRVITFSDCPAEFFSPVMTRLEKDQSRIRTYPNDYLAWAILDIVVDHYLVISEQYENELDNFDTILLGNTERIDSARLFSFKSEINKINRQIRPVREIIHDLKRSENPILTPESRPFFDDLFDHIIHAIEDSEQLREQASEIRDFYMATVNSRMNGVMKLLTCFSAIFLPLTFLAGVYGMNFDHMPELEWKWSYPLVWCIFLISTISLLIFFRKRKWL